MKLLPRAFAILCLLIACVGMPLHAQEDPGDDLPFGDDLGPEDGPPGRPGAPPRPGVAPADRPPQDSYGAAPGTFPPPVGGLPPPDFGNADRGGAEGFGHGGVGSQSKVSFHLTGEKKKITKTKDLHQLLMSSENWKTPAPPTEAQPPKE